MGFIILDLHSSRAAAGEKQNDQNQRSYRATTSSSSSHYQSLSLPLLLPLLLLSCHYHDHSLSFHCYRYCYCCCYYAATTSVPLLLSPGSSSIAPKAHPTNAVTPDSEVRPPIPKELQNLKVPKQRGLQKPNPKPQTPEPPAGETAPSLDQRSLCCKRGGAGGGAGAPKGSGHVGLAFEGFLRKPFGCCFV